MASRSSRRGRAGWTGVLLSLALICAAPADAAIEPAVLDVNAVPHLDQAGRASYLRFLLVNLPRAFALAPDGKMGWYGGSGSIEDARSKALKSCADKGATGCVLYAEDLSVVWPGRPPGIFPPVPGPLLQTIEYAFVPDPRFIWRGPGAAAGIYVWGHGQNNMADSRGLQPQAHVRAFNNAGFDVVRFDREPSRDYRDDAAAWLRQGLELFRRQGWRKIVAGGQSRGGWSSLQSLDRPGLADAVIAISPASFSGGTDNSGDAYRLIHAVHAPTTRVAIAQFKGDIYVNDMDRRVALYRDGLSSRVGSLLMIDQPPGFTGHGAGGTIAFALGYADCLLHFVMDPTPPASCPPPKP
jgi:hypothetical protein